MTSFTYIHHSREGMNPAIVIIRLLLLIVTILSFYTNAFAVEDKIVAIINKQPITLSALEQRKKITKFFTGASHFSADQEKAFATQVLHAMIDDEVLSQYAEKIGIKISEREIKNFIKHIEVNNKMPEGQFTKAIMNLHVTHEAFEGSIRAEVLRSKIIHEVLGEQINVTRNEVDTLILDRNYRDAKLSLKVFTARRNNDNAYKSMSKLSDRIRNCAHLSHLRYNSFATLQDIETTLSALPPNVQSMMKDMHIDEATRVIKDEKLHIYVLCDKQIEGFSDADASKVHQMVANKHLNIKARKFLQTIRKKAYIKVLI